MKELFFQHNIELNSEKISKRNNIIKQLHVIDGYSYEKKYPLLKELIKMENKLCQIRKLSDITKISITTLSQILSWDYTTNKVKLLVKQKKINRCQVGTILHYMNKGNAKIEELQNYIVEYFIEIKPPLRSFRNDIADYVLYNDLNHNCSKLPKNKNNKKNHHFIRGINRVIKNFSSQLHELSKCELTIKNKIRLTEELEKIQTEINEAKFIIRTHRIS